MLKWDADSLVTFHADGHTVHDFERRFQMEDDGEIPSDKTFRWKMVTERSAHDPTTDIRGSTPS